MGIFRSEIMKHGTLVLPSDRAREYLDCLGKEVDIQFIDMNEKTMKRQYKKYIQRIDDMERILRFLEENINKLPNVKIKKSKIDNFLEHDNIYELDQVEESLNRLHVQFVRFCNNNKDLIDEKNNAIEEKHVILTALNQLSPGVIRGVGGFRGSVIGADQQHHHHNNNNIVSPFDEEGVEENNISLSTHIMKDGINMMFTNISGVIKTKDQESFSRTIFRAFRGNTYTYFQNIDEDADDNDLLKNVEELESLKSVGDTNNMYKNNKQHDTFSDKLDGKDKHDKKKKKDLKSVFVVYCQGSAQSNIYDKIMKICKAYDVKTYDWPRTYEHAKKRLKELREIINDKEKALKAYEEYFINEIFVLINVVEPNKNSLIEEWKLFCKKERHIYNNLNYFEGSDITLRCDCWYSANDEEKIRHILINKSSNDLVSALLLSDKILRPNVSPPTYIKTNEFTKSYQSMVDTYGVPRYGEINPAISTIITFPFLFGIMYGDVGHGLCIFLFALFLIIMNNKVKNKKNNNEMVTMLFDGRYMLLLMGFFAVYAGFLYNDFFSMPLNLFSSMFMLDKQVDNMEYYKRREITDSATGEVQYAYPYIFGFDCKWLGAENELTYINSFKMKFSIIIGFIHMTFGVLMKGFNALHFKRKMDFFFEFLPQLIMMLSMIGYLVFLIIYKWVTPVGYGGFQKQGIINTIINMYLMKEINSTNQFYPYQNIIQILLLSLFVLCIPFMFICKPAIRTYHIMKEKQKIKDHNMHKKNRRGKKTMAKRNNNQNDNKKMLLTNQNYTEAGAKEMINAFHHNAKTGGILLSTNSKKKIVTSDGNLNNNNNNNLLSMHKRNTMNNKISSSHYHNEQHDDEYDGYDEYDEYDDDDDDDNYDEKEYLNKKKKKRTDDDIEAHLLSSTYEEKGLQSSSAAMRGSGEGEENHHEENISEIWIEQLIETIEFILGLISNTASYLRLWALSLAHQQLSFVFFEQTILNSLKRNSFMSVLINLILFSQLFSILTIAVILCMDTLECFLHSLRLQWVEFQNKFYKGDGIPFKPFNIKKLLNENE
ncbi:vacuolar proton translocating ATPase subunit A, putative [Plasmodium reichenowi]|uniref:Vacuolar proton translocating ATPase subunit A, putative n=1 Tax=Plasmodium reichenowi TaxID=5854 RepID=A0A151LJX6_PLARE|nr:vacuolar proton translocating ATPase subunit A, putative [Plasmodium reichenowi]KYN99167.1 vacuolar proton translocating ATPase subunit A, putative [Plasmodium reichenowi]